MSYGIWVFSKFNTELYNFLIVIKSSEIEIPKSKRRKSKCRFGTVEILGSKKRGVRFPRLPQRLVKECFENVIDYYIYIQFLSTTSRVHECYNVTTLFTKNMNPLDKFLFSKVLDTLYPATTDHFTSPPLQTILLYPDKQYNKLLGRIVILLLIEWQIHIYNW